MNLKGLSLPIRQFDIWLADLNPRFGTEPGKVRPVVIVQTDMLNDEHPSTIICPVTSRVQPDAGLLRIRLRDGQLDRPSAVLVDQIRAIDNKRLMSRVGRLNRSQIIHLKEGIAAILEL